MKKILLAIVFAAFTAVSAAAIEEIPEVEIFGGYSLMKMNVSNNDIRYFQEGVYEWNGTWKNSDTSFFLNQGVAGSVAYNFNEYFSIVTDGKYRQGDLIKGIFEFECELPELPGIMIPVQAPFTIDMKNVSALAGPRFSYRNLLNERANVFVHALAGLDYWRLNCDFTVAGEKQSSTGNKFSPGVAIGGGIDINLNEKIAVRAIQADYYMTRQLDRRMSNVNLSFGIVFRIGEKILK